MKAPEPSVDGRPLSVQRGIVLTDYPETYFMKHGRHGYIWMFEDRLMFRQTALESFYRPDDLTVEIMLDDMGQVSVLRPGRPIRSLLRILLSDAKALRLSYYLQAVAKAGEAHMSVTPYPGSVADALNSLSALSKSSSDRGADYGFGANAPILPRKRPKPDMRRRLLGIAANRAIGTVIEIILVMLMALA